MNLLQKQQAVRTLALRVKNGTGPPPGVVDLIVFHVLHLHLPLRIAEQSFKRLKRDFVDWNEVRVSPPREVAAALGASQGAHQAAEQILAFLRRVHEDQQQTSLECLNEMTIAQARKYLRSLGSLTTATIDLILRVKKSQATVPLDKETERVLVRLGVVPARSTLRQKQKVLRKLVSDEEVFSFHRSAVDLARSVCREKESQVRCSECPLRNGCAWRRRLRRRNGVRPRRRRR